LARNAACARGKGTGARDIVVLLILCEDELLFGRRPWLRRDLLVLGQGRLPADATVSIIARAGG
jgi:hypothetical protein